MLANWPDYIDAHRGLATIYFDLGALPPGEQIIRDAALVRLRRKYDSPLCLRPLPNYLAIAKQTHIALSHGHSNSSMVEAD